MTKALDANSLPLTVASPNAFLGSVQNVGTEMQFVRPSFNCARLLQMLRSFMPRESAAVTYLGTARTLTVFVEWSLYVNLLVQTESYLSTSGQQFIQISSYCSSDLGFGLNQTDFTRFRSWLKCCYVGSIRLVPVKLVSDQS